MVNRYSFVSSKDKLLNSLGKVEILQAYSLNYNITPLQKAHIITIEEQDVVQKYTWGLLPAWSRNTQNSGNLYNAKAEGIVSKPSFRIPLREKRCIILADSFYLTNNEGHTYRVYQKDRDILMFAGIYDHHISQRGINKTFAIITTPSNRDTIQLNKRNPVIFSKEERKKWLNKNTGINDVLSLLKVNESYSLVSYRITDAINNSSLNNPILHEEIGVSNMLFDF